MMLMWETALTDNFKAMDLNLKPLKFSILLFYLFHIEIPVFNANSVEPLNLQTGQTSVIQWLT